MNEKIKKKIALVRERLEGDPGGLVAGELRPGRPDIAVSPDGSATYYEFLSEANGARCGSIDLWSAEEIPGKQFMTVALPGGGDRWLSIGQVVYEPLVIDRKTGDVAIFQQGPPMGLPGAEQGDLDRFLDESVFGPRYAEIIPDSHDEEWFQILQELGFA